MDSTVISAISWVSKGFAQANPKEIQMTEEQVEILKNEPSIKKNLQKELNPQIDNQMMDENEEFDDFDDDEFGDMPVFASELKNLKKEDNDPSGLPFGIDEMSDQEKEDFTIQKSDSIIVAAKIEKEFSTLQVYIYQETKNNLYVHHEITLSAFPLSLEWLSVQPKSFDAEIAQQGNYAIVSSFLPEIEIWDLDVINVIEPTIVLGGVIQQNLTHSKKPQKLKKKQGFKQDSHTDAVLNINLNQFRKNILASGSADTTVKVWDLSNQQCMATFNHHKDKVQVVQWNPKEEAILLSGGFDQKLHIFDARSPSSSVSCIIPSDIESALWDPINQFNIVFSTENGLVTQCDARKFGEQPVFSFAAHNQSTTSVSMSSKVPGLLCTTSEDGTVKAWDTLSLNPNPLLVAMKNPKAGQLFCGAFYDDLPWVFACGNSKGELFIWDSTEDKRIVEKFGSRVDASLRPKLEDCNAVIFETKPSQKEKNDKNEDDDDDDDDQGMRD